MHAQTLKAGFLPLLGRAILARIYRHASTDPNAILLVALEGDVVRGFVLGAVAPRAFYFRFSVRHCMTVGWHLVTQPLTIFRALSIARYASLSQGIKAELLSIAVDPAYSRQGIGAALLTAFRIRLAAQDIAMFRVTASDTQKQAIAFYRKHGGEIIARVTLGGLPSSVFSMHA
jgi:ribosomal protein S18 acetylase RimI-like enzyme